MSKNNGYIMSTLEILEVISSRKEYITLSLMLFISMLLTGPFVVAEEHECSNSLAVTHTVMSTYDDYGNNMVRGIVYIKNTGNLPAYILGVEQLIQSDHSPHWITIKDESLLPMATKEGAAVIGPGEYEKIVFTTVFVPELGNDSYRNRMEIYVLDPQGTTTKYLSDQYISLPDRPPASTKPPTTVPPTTTPPTTLPPTTLPPTTTPPTTTPPTTLPPTTLPPITEPPVTQPPFPPIDVGQGSITNIEADVCHGGSSVYVELTVASGSFTSSSLQLVVTSQEDANWKIIYEKCLEINLGGEGMTAENTPLIFCFDDLELTGNTEDYYICATWKQGMACERNAPVISRKCIGCNNLPKLDYLTYGVVIAVLLLVGAFFMKKVSKD